MTQSTDPNILAAVFLRKGTEGLKTKCFENFSTAKKDAILTKAALGLGEEPVIAYFDRATDWFLVTNQRLIWSNLDGLHSINILQLDHVESNFDAAWKRWEVADDRETRNPKMEIDELDLVTVDGRRAAIALEPGLPFDGLLNALKWLCRWAKLRREET